MPTLTRNVAVLTMDIDQPRYLFGTFACLTSLLLCMLVEAEAVAVQPPQSVVTANQGSSSSTTSVLVQDDDSGSGIQSNPGFIVPPSPTARSFTDPQSPETNVINDGSQAVGTFAISRPEDRANFQDVNNDPRFDPPQPPVVSSAPTHPLSPRAGRPMIGQSENPPAVRPHTFEEPDHASRLPRITQNGLRAARSSDDRPANDLPSDNNLGQPDRFERNGDELRPAMHEIPPVAAMPDSRFNSRLYSTEVQSNGDQRQDADAVAQSSSVSSERSSVMVVDENVTPTSYVQNGRQFGDQTAPSSSASDGARLAEQIIQRYSMDNATDPLPGQPASLRDMLQPPLPLRSRQPMVHQYWETWYDWATLQNAKEYRTWLNDIPNASSASDNGLLQAARSQADDKVLAAEIQLTKSQSRLQQFMQASANDLPPLPSDLPLIETYETHYELYQSRRMLPVSLRGINEMLPKTLELIGSRAKTVQMAQVAIKQTQDGYQSRQSTVAAVLEAGRVWRSAEQDLLASVTSYNQAIADYALNVTRRYTSPEQTVAMLIGNPKPIVRQSAASNRQPQRQSSVVQNGFGQNQPAQNGFNSGSLSQNNRQADARPSLSNAASSPASNAGAFGAASPAAASAFQGNNGFSASGTRSQPNPQVSSQPRSQPTSFGNRPTANNTFSAPPKSPSQPASNRTANQFNGFGP